MAIVILSSLLFFTVFWYFGRKAFFEQHLVGWFPSTRFEPLYPFFYFIVCSLVLRMALPALCIRYWLRRPLSDFGWSLRGVRRDAWLYGALFLAVVPFVVYASTTPAFLDYYPQFKEVIVDGRVSLGAVVVFELAYLFLFVSGESFWRGYLVFGLERKLGYHGVLVMVIPYVMSHYEKPFLETLGAIVTGCVLGVLALRHRSFWLGVAVHYGVALTMDLLALHNGGIRVSP